MFTVLVMLNLTLSSLAQQEKILFSDAIQSCLKKYNQSCDEAVKNGDFERVDFLFDSLVKHRLKGTFIENLSLRKLKGGFFETENAKRPFLIATTTSWYIKSNEEIEAINTLAEEFDGKIDIVVLFWDTKKNAKKIAKFYKKNVIVTFVDEASNKNNSIISVYKHTLGFPSVFYVTTNNTIININRGGIVKLRKEPNKILYANNYKFYHKSIVQLLVSDSTFEDTILTGTD